MARSRFPMTPLDPKRKTRFQRMSTGRFEVWGAVSKDGVWKYVRLDDVGTPWEVEHVESGRRLRSWFGSLAQARRATAAPGVMEQLEARPVSVGASA
jgi:hypothetical protein